MPAVAICFLLRVADQAHDEDRDLGEDENFDARVLTAAQLATPELVWVELDASAHEIAQVTRREGTHRVLVRQDGKLVGSVSALDLCSAVSE